MSGWSRNGRARSGWSGSGLTPSPFAKVKLEVFNFDRCPEHMAGNEIVRRETALADAKRVTDKVVQGLTTRGGEHPEGQGTIVISSQRGWRATVEVGDSTAAQATARANAAFDAILGMVPSRVLPSRINSEVIGDALERIGAAAANGRSRWYLRALFVITLFVVLLEVVRYIARSVRGEKALRR